MLTFKHLKIVLLTKGPKQGKTKRVIFFSLCMTVLYCRDVYFMLFLYCFKCAQNFMKKKIILLCIFIFGSDYKSVPHNVVLQLRMCYYMSRICTNIKITSTKRLANVGLKQIIPMVRILQF